MDATVIERQYEDVIAATYDRDPQGLTVASLEKSIDQIESVGLLDASLPPMSVLDVGMGTGLFLERLIQRSQRSIRPHGIDLSVKMVEQANVKIPGLVSRVGDALDLDCYFAGLEFDLICTHFVTGFVSIDSLGPLIESHLPPGGHWALAGGTMEAFPELQAKAEHPLIRRLCGGSPPSWDEMVTNPSSTQDVARRFTELGLEVAQADEFEPSVKFADFDDFMEFGYRGGWLTPLIESIGLHEAGAVIRAALNLMVFPIEDHHSIAIAIGRKSGHASD